MSSVQDQAKLVEQAVMKGLDVFAAGDPAEALDVARDAVVNRNLEQIEPASNRLTAAIKMVQGCEAVVLGLAERTSLALDVYTGHVRTVVEVCSHSVGVGHQEMPQGIERSLDELNNLYAQSALAMKECRIQPGAFMPGADVFQKDIQGGLKLLHAEFQRVREESKSTEKHARHPGFLGPTQSMR
jgi:hypothetical protein